MHQEKMRVIKFACLLFYKNGYIWSVFTFNMASSENVQIVFVQIQAQIQIQTQIQIPTQIPTQIQIPTQTQSQIQTQVRCEATCWVR